jgi:hypothetical protein
LGEIDLLKPKHIARLDPKLVNPQRFVGGGHVGITGKALKIVPLLGSIVGYRLNA